VAVAAVVGAALVAGVGILSHGYQPTEMLFFGIALAVSVIPEGLPAALTVALSVATTRMARRGVIVRRLAAVEGLGSCTLIASDKTGTLTCNQLTVREVRLANGDRFLVTGEGYVPEGQVFQGDAPVDPQHRADLDALARAGVLCNEGDLHRRDGGWTWRGDPTDIALLALAQKVGWERKAVLEQHPQINQIPFEPEYRFSATYHRLRPASGFSLKGHRSGSWPCATGPGGRKRGRSWRPRPRRWPSRATASWPWRRVRRRRGSTRRRRRRSRAGLASWASWA
jgi:magnesium-transporting ATPase (P-type)